MIPMKGDYSRRDFARTARLMGLPFTMPPTFPFASVPHARAFYWIEAQDAGKARMFARGVYQVIFGEGRTSPARTSRGSRASSATTRATSPAACRNPP